MINKIEFKVTENDVEHDLAIRRPDLADIREAQKTYNVAFKDALSSGAIFRQKLSDAMKEQGLWDDNKQAQLTSLLAELNQSELKLKKGGKNFRLSDAAKLAFRMTEIRREIGELRYVFAELDSSTIQGQAENAKLNYLVYACLVYNKTEKRFYKDFSEFQSHSNDVVAQTAFQKLMELQYGQDETNNLPEYKFLRQYKFVDENNRRINKDGHFVDEEGRLIDENYNYVAYDENGDKYLVDAEGNPIHSDGEYKVDFEGFLDDESGEVVGLFEKGGDETAEELPTTETQEIE